MVRLFALVLLLVTMPTLAFADDAERVEKHKIGAMKGDYQDQRNLAYTLSTSSDPFVENKMLGCAWRKLILLSGSQRIDATDIQNEKFYCGKLSPEEQAAATKQAERLYKEIY